MVGNYRATPLLDDFSEICYQYFAPKGAFKPIIRMLKTFLRFKNHFTMKFTNLCLLLIFQLTTVFNHAQTEALKQQIENFTKTKKAEVGVSIVSIEGKDTLFIGKNDHYPMQSVYKFHLALAVLNQVDKGKLALNQKILVEKSDLLPDLWSPMREKYPEGNVELPLSEILTYTVAQSDNSGCDILFRLVGGPKKVHKYIRKLGIKEVSITAPEAIIQRDWSVQFSNWTTPQSMTQLLEKFYKGNILSKNSYDFLWKTMVETTTGLKRLKGLLPSDVVIAHKTGYSGANKEGVMAAVNDVGIVTLPNGQHFAIAVFITNTTENLETSERIIAEIAKMAWDYFTTR
jgi:beta-lactamase class A